MNDSEAPSAKRVKIEGLRHQLHYEAARETANEDSPSTSHNESTGSASANDDFTSQEMIAELIRRDHLLMCDCGVAYFAGDPTSPARTLHYLHRSCHSGTDWKHCAICNQTLQGREQFMSHMFGTHKSVRRPDQ